MKSIIKNKHLWIVMFFVFITTLAMAQGAHPGTDPEGMPTPVDGGILMAILGASGLVTMYFKKNNKNKKK